MGRWIKSYMGAIKQCFTISKTIVSFYNQKEKTKTLLVGTLYSKRIRQVLNKAK